MRFRAKEQRLKTSLLRALRFWFCCLSLMFCLFERSATMFAIDPLSLLILILSILQALLGG